MCIHLNTRSSSSRTQPSAKPCTGNQRLLRTSIGLMVELFLLGDGSRLYLINHLDLARNLLFKGFQAIFI